MKKILFLVLGLLAVSANAQSFRLESLPRGYGYSINNQGLVSGLNYESGYAVPSFFDYRSNQYFSTRLPETYGATSITDINDSGDAVGISSLVPGPVARRHEHAMFFFRSWDGRYYPLDLPHLPGYSLSEALAINEQNWKVGHDISLAKNGAWVQRTAVAWVPDSNGITSTVVPLPCSNSGDEWRLNHAGSGALTVTNDGLIGGHCGRRPTVWYWGFERDISGDLPEEILLSDGTRRNRAEFLDHAFCRVSRITNNYKFVVNCPGGYSFVSSARSSFPLRQFIRHNLNKVKDMNSSGAIIWESHGGNMLYNENRADYSTDDVDLTARYGMYSAALNDNGQISAPGMLLNPVGP